MPNRSRTSRPAGAGIDPAVLRATASGTASFRSRFAAHCAPDFFRESGFGPLVSSIGIGTYLGDSTDDVDQEYEDAIRQAVGRGVNLIDSAINYRCQRSELAIGAAIQRLIADGLATREEIVVCTKGGYVPLDREAPRTRDDYQAYLKREFFDPEILHPDDLVAGGHSLAPRFLRYCLAKSRQNLGLRTIDVYYLHNPGQQLVQLSWNELRLRLRAAFEVLEDAAARGHIGVYGIATWDELRSASPTSRHLPLEQAVMLAREVAGESHHFKVIQVPLNLAMPEAVATGTQQVRDSMLPTVAAAEALGLSVVTSATLMQGRLANDLSAQARQLLPGYDTDAQRAIAFARGAPGVTAALVGMRQQSHLAENLATVGQHAVE